MERPPLDFLIALSADDKALSGYAALSRQGKKTVLDRAGSGEEKIQSLLTELKNHSLQD